MLIQQEYDIEQMQERERAVRQLESDILDVNKIFKVTFRFFVGFKILGRVPDFSGFLLITARMRRGCLTIRIRHSR